MAAPAPRGDDRTALLHDVLEVALAVARQGDGSDAPAPLRPYLRMRHRVPRALAAADRAGDDDAFRARVALVVGDDDLGPAEALWLTRPEGWEADLEALVDAHRAAREEGDARRLLDRERRAREAAEADRDRAAAQADEAEATRDEARAAAEGAEAATTAAERRAEAALEERAAAIASLKDLEAAHARAHEELRTLRDDRDALCEERDVLRTERDALRTERDAGRTDPETGDGPGPSPRTVPDGCDDTAAAPTADDDGARPGPGLSPAVGEAVAASAAAAADLAASLAAVAAHLGHRAEPPTTAETATRTAGDAGPRPERRRPGGRGPRARGGRGPLRRPVPLPGGVHDDSVEAAEHLVRLPRAALLVDGYNVSMATWPDLAIDAQRRRLVAALGDLQARCGAEVVVVFDGVDDGSLRPVRPDRPLRVEFTPDAVEADDVIIERVARVRPGRPVVVVSDDRRVRDGARAGGANLLTTDQLRAVIGRRAG